MSPRPPYSALRVFVEVATHKSVTQAAAALGVTPGAVSQQIKAAEERLGVTLLSRAGGRIALTPVGNRLIRRLTEAFRDIDQVTQEVDLRACRRGRITVTTVSSFAVLWLGPRLKRFYAKYPNIEVSVETTPRIIDLEHEAVDLAIRYGQGSYPGLRVLSFLHPRLVPICSSSLLRNGPGLRTAKDCLSYPLLHDYERSDWAHWLKAQSLPEVDLEQGPRFSDDLMMWQAVASGQGIGLMRDIYFSSSLFAGEILPAPCMGTLSASSFRLVTSREGGKRPEVAAFTKWLLHEAKANPIGEIMPPYASGLLGGVDAVERSATH